jgi:acyl-CoA synthetase (AMP-forming)/AMP-acid ligase II
MTVDGRATTFVEMLRAHAERRPEHTIFSFLGEDDAVAGTLTYGALDRRARAIAAWLQSTTREGDRALILYHPGLEYIAALFGCLYAGVVAVPAYPPRPNRTMARIETIVADAEAGVALTTAAMLPKLLDPAVATAEMRALRWLSTDTLPPRFDAAWRPPAVRGESLAILQYTSGSTGAPKGVMVSHANLLHNAGLIDDVGATIAPGPRRAVCWLPPYHDMGLVAGIMEPVFGGAHCVIMSPLAFLQRPARWLRAISEHRAEVSGGPNFAYDLCVEKITPEQRAGLDLSCWKMAVSGAEPVRAETIERFAATFASAGFRREAFYPCYGLAEGTLFVTGAPAPGGPPVVRSFDQAALEEHRVVATAPAGEAAHRLVGCGGALSGQRIAIVDPDTRVPCGADEVGEIWLVGPSVARGYWNRPEETAHTFGARLADGKGGPFLRTGDLGFVRDGVLFVTARLKDLIIIRGLNHCPQDIELTSARSHLGLRAQAAAAFSIEVAGEERLIVLQELDRTMARGLEADTVLSTIQAAIVEHHGIDAHAVLLLRPGSLPKTSSGKIQRHACRVGFVTGAFRPLAERRAPAPRVPLATGAAVAI